MKTIKYWNIKIPVRLPRFKSNFIFKSQNLVFIRYEYYRCRLLDINLIYNNNKISI